MPTRSIGVIGLGHMGAAFARRLLGGGESVFVYDLRPEAATDLIAEGASPAESATRMADLVDTIVVCVDSPAASLAIAEAAAGGQRLTTYLETSTIGPDAIAEIARQLDGVDVIDAPVSGGPRSIATGTLSTYLAGDSDAIARVRPWLERIAATMIVVGDRPGMAQITKLVNNAISLSSMVISCEAMAVGVAAGLDPETLLSAINAGTGRNSATLTKIPTSILTGRFDYGGPVGLAAKDLQLYRDLAASVGIEQSSLSSADDSINATIAQRGASADYSEMIRIFEEATGVTVRANVSRASQPSIDL